MTAPSTPWTTPFSLENTSTTGWPSSGDPSNGGNWYAPPPGANLFGPGNSSTGGAWGGAQNFLNGFVGDMGKGIVSSMQNSSMPDLSGMIGLRAGVDGFSSAAQQLVQVPIALGANAVSRHAGLTMLGDHGVFSAEARRQAHADSAAQNAMRDSELAAYYGPKNGAQSWAEREASGPGGNPFYKGPGGHNMLIV
jgi:hypothetical protein